MSYPTDQDFEEAHADGRPPKQRVTARVMSEVYTERERQDHKWGEQNHNAFVWLAILHEETGEAAKAMLESSPAGYRAELVQVAAVAIAAIESLDRNKTRADTEEKPA